MFDRAPEILRDDEAALVVGIQGGGQDLRELGFLRELVPKPKRPR